MRNETSSKNFYFVSNDQMFKTIFANHKLMKKLLEQCLKRSVRIVHYNPTEQIKESFDERGKVLDIVVELDEEIVNIEMNIVYDEEHIKRNFAYLCKLHAQNIKRDEKYLNQKGSIQINLCFIKDREMIKCYEMYDKENNKKLPVRFSYIEINLDKYLELWYAKDDKKMKESSLLIATAIRDKKELEEYTNYIQDEDVKKVRDDTMYLNENGDYVSELSLKERIEMEQRYYINEAKKKGLAQGIKEGEAQGMKKGIKEGIKEGINQEKIELAKKLIADDFDDETIAKYTELSLEEIQNLRK